MKTLTKAGDVVVITEGPKKGSKVKLTRPVTRRDMAYGPRWEVPGYRWIESRQKFSSNAYSFSSGEEPRVIDVPIEMTDAISQN